VVEPISYLTGQSQSDDFLRDLGSLTRDSETALIIDERNTGCGASGKGFWAYNGDEADYVVFGKKT